MLLDADYAPPGYFDPPHAVVEAYTIVERFWGRGLDKASDALLRAYQNASYVLNSRINTGSILHSYTVSLAHVPCCRLSDQFLGLFEGECAQVTETEPDAGATIFTEGMVADGTVLCVVSAPLPCDLA